MNQNHLFSQGRRNVIIGATAVAGLAASGAALASSGHDHHHANSANAKLVDASLNCIKTGQACLSHCMSEFKNGNKKMVDCATSVQEMLTMCDTMSQMASFESKHIKKVAQACIDVCESCANECDKHAKDHITCENCRNACKDCIKAMKDIG